MKIIWESMRTTPAPRDGHYFAVPIREAHAPLVSADAVVRANREIHPFHQVVIREPVEPGKPRLLALVISPFADLKDSAQLGSLMRIWELIETWYCLAMENTECRPIDEVFRAGFVHDDMPISTNAV
jgi:hypothetical protein